jgi:hypothetical protein
MSALTAEQMEYNRFWETACLDMAMEHPAEKEGKTEGANTGDIFRWRRSIENQDVIEINQEWEVKNVFCCVLLEEIASAKLVEFALVQWSTNELTWEPLWMLMEDLHGDLYVRLHHLPATQQSTMEKTMDLVPQGWRVCR